MTFEQAVFLSAIAGATIFLGLPVGRLRNLSTKTQALLTTGAAGVILFLIWDILTAAVEPVESSLEAASHGEGPTGDFAVNLVAFAVSIAFGLLSLVWFASRTRKRRAAGLSTQDIALGTAIGLGLHNLSEGLAIGQSAAIGETAFALVLVIGFALHNATEGFGICAPLSGEAEMPTWGFLALLGLIGGGPTFVGTALGQAWTSEALSVVFLALAGGSILYVVIELLNVLRGAGSKAMVTWGLLLGLVLGFGTDFILVAVGA